MDQGPGIGPATTEERMMTRTIYPKTYATVIFRDGFAGTVVARIDGQDRLVTLELGWRNGRGKTGEIAPGRRVKIYQRPGRPHVNFRMVGS